MPIMVSTMSPNMCKLCPRSIQAHRGGLPERISTYYWFHFDLPLDLVRQGENDLEVTMDRHFRPLTADRVLLQVELRIVYVEPPIPVQGQM